MGSSFRTRLPIGCGLPRDDGSGLHECCGVVCSAAGMKVTVIVRVRMRTITVNFVPVLCSMLRVVVVFLRCCVYYA
jgi:hypothetical protein